jgi:uncharacterized protein (TIGR02466 family)
MTEIKLHKLFPVPVFEVRLPNYPKLNEDLEKYILDLKEKNPKGLTKSNAGGWHSPYFDMKNSNPVKQFIANFSKPLYEVISNHMNYKCNPQDVIILNMWSIINKKNTFNIKHNHPNSIMSAAYYVKAKKKSGKIAFHDPKDVKVMYHPPIKEHNEISCEEVKIEPEEGKLLLFPAYLQHSVEENLSEDERIVISFNINIARANQQINYF